jgi:hypothetical protein
MAKKHDNFEEKESAEIEVKEVEKTEEGIKVKKELGFINGKRSFFEGGKNIIVIEGGTISKEDFDLFTEDAQKLLFEK